MKEKHYKEIEGELNRSAAEINKIEDKRIDMGKMFEAEIRHYLENIA